MVKAQYAGFTTDKEVMWLARQYRGDDDPRSGGNFRVFCLIVGNLGNARHANLLIDHSCVTTSSTQSTREIAAAQQSENPAFAHGGREVIPRYVVATCGHGEHPVGRCI